MKTRVLALASVLLLAACAGPGADEAGTQEQAGTAGQDVDVARLRRAFRDARSIVPSAGNLNDLVSAGSKSPTGMRYAWQCERRDAKLDTPRGATPAVYSFVPIDGRSFRNETTAFGAEFIHDPDIWELIGYAQGFTPGPIAQYQAVRSDGRGLVMEQRMAPTVASLSAADQAAWFAAQQLHETSTTGAGLATAYTYCPTRKGFAGGVPVAFFDDFEDGDFSKRHWSAPTPIGGGSLELLSSSNQVWASIEDSFDTIGFTMTDRAGITRIGTPSVTIIISDQWLGTDSGGAQQVPLDVPPSGKVSFRLFEGVVQLLIDNTPYRLFDRTARPHLSDGWKSSISFSTTGHLRIDDLQVTNH